jgi:hypothetical protein
MTSRRDPDHRAVDPQVRSIGLLSSWRRRSSGVVRGHHDVGRDSLREPPMKTSASGITATLSPSHGFICVIAVSRDANTAPCRSGEPRVGSRDADNFRSTIIRVLSRVWHLTRSDDVGRFVPLGVAKRMLATPLPVNGARPGSNSWAHEGRLHGRIG